MKTTNKYSKSTRSIDTESRKPRVSLQKMKKPQPKLAPIEDSSDEYISDQTDQEIESELEMKVKDDTRRSNVKMKSERRKSRKDTSRQEASHEMKESVSPDTSVITAKHMLLRTSVYHMMPAPITFPNASTYKPSSYMMFYTLNAAHNIVFSNTYLNRLYPHYLTVASTLYYGMIFYLQILRAKTVAGIITKAESQCIRRFEREFPFETLPIMSPIILHLQNLGAVKLADPIYSWICPTLPTTIGTASNIPGIFASSDDIMLPNVPALIRFLYEIGTATDLNDITEDHTLVPASRVAGNTNFFGINLAAGQQANGNFQRLVYSGGLLAPPEITESLDESIITRINRWNLPNLSAATDLTSIGSFMQTDGNLEWFKNLINMCTEEAKFFEGSTNLSSIAPTSGLSSLIEISYIGRNHPTPIDDIYPFSTRGFPSDIWQFKGITTRGDTNTEEFGIGATTQFLVTNYGRIVPNGHAGPAQTLTGAYFDPLMGGRQIKQIETSSTRTPKLAYEQIIRGNLYDSTGGQNKPN
jgi:hypothetical protein